MMSAARLRRAEQRISHLRPYAKALRRMTRQAAEAAGSGEMNKLPILREHESQDKVALLLITAGTRVDKAGESLSVIREEIARLAKDGPTDQEVAEAKSYLIGSYPLGFASHDSLAAYVLSLQLAGRGRDFIDQYPGLIGAVTPAQVKAVAARVLQVKDPTAVVAGTPAS